MAATAIRAARKATQMSREAGKAKTGDSTLAGLAGRTTPAAASAARPAALATGNNFTGQYLYDRFITDGAKEDVTKMDIVRQMVGALDVKQFGQVVSDFVGVAKGFFDNAVTAAKNSPVRYDEKNPPIEVRQAQARLRTARTQQTVMRIAYGALTFAADELAKLGGSDQTGFMLMRELGAKALENKGINWDNTKAEPKPTPEQKAALKQQREEADALVQVQQANPRKEDESRVEYFTRIDKLVEKAVKAKRAAEHEAQVKDLASKIREMVGDNFDEVLDLLLTPPEAAPAPDAALH